VPQFVAHEGVALVFWPQTLSSADREIAICAKRERVAACDSAPRSSRARGEKARHDLGCEARVIFIWLRCSGDSFQKPKSWCREFVVCRSAEQHEESCVSRPAARLTGARATGGRDAKSRNYGA